jgi:hypothetical protein
MRPAGSGLETHDVNKVKWKFLGPENGVDKDTSLKPCRVVNNTDVSDDHSTPVSMVKQDCSKRWNLSEDSNIH